MKEQALFIHTGEGFSSQLVELFEQEGFFVEQVGDRQQSWKRIAESHYSLIFCNLQSGAAGEADFVKELCARVRVPCQILVSGPDQVSVAVKVLQHGARHYWARPIDLEEVRRLLIDGAFAAQDWRSRRQRESTLLQVIKEVALNMEMDGLVNILIDSSVELTGADGGALLLLEEKTNSLIAKAVRGLSGKERENEFFGLTEDKYQEILWGKQPVFFHHMDPPLLTSNKVRIDALMGTPIWWKEEPLGVLVVVKFDGEQSFSSDDFKLISLLSSQISGAVYNAVTHQRTKELTIKDDLTEAYNRRYFDRYLEEEFLRAGRYGSNLSLIFFDVDNLKEVNVKYGHLIGSKTLQEIAHRIILTVRGIDRVVRYGGDEFCIVLPETDTQGAYQVADRIRNTIASDPFYVNDIVQVHLTGSMGIASYPAHAATRDELIRQADRAMFAIKNRTKNAIGVAEAIPSSR